MSAPLGRRDVAKREPRVCAVLHAQPAFFVVGRFRASELSTPVTARHTCIKIRILARSAAWTTRSRNPNETRAHATGGVLFLLIDDETPRRESASRKRAGPA